MAISFSNKISDKFDGVSSTRTLNSIVTATGTTRVVTCIYANGGSGFSATHNGDAMTSIGSIGQSGYTIYAFERANPDIGTYDIVFSWTGNISGCMVAATYIGDNPNLSLSASFSTNSSASNGSLSVSHTAITGWTILFAGSRKASPTLTASTGSTLREVGTANGDSMIAGIFDSNANVAGSTSMDVTCTAASIVNGLIVSLPIENAISISDTNISLDTYNSGIQLKTISDTNVTTDSFSTPSWSNKGKMSQGSTANTAKSSQGSTVNTAKSSQGSTTNQQKT